MSEIERCKDGTINGGQRPCFVLRTLAGGAQQNLPPMCPACAKVWMSMMPNGAPVAGHGSVSIEQARILYDAGFSSGLERGADGGSFEQALGELGE